MVLNSQLLQWLIIVLFVWVIVLTILLVQSQLHYRKLTKNISKKDLKTILSQILSQTNLNQKQLIEIQSRVQKIRHKLRSHIQKIGFIRFNPFPQTGGNQSFSLALLDENDDGFVLSSLHSRDATRFYAKAVKKAKGDGYQLSKEEIKAIKSAK